MKPTPAQSLRAVQHVRKVTGNYAKLRPAERWAMVWFLCTYFMAVFCASSTATWVAHLVDPTDSWLGISLIVLLVLLFMAPVILSLQYFRKYTRAGMILGRSDDPFEQLEEDTLARILVEMDGGIEKEEPTVLAANPFGAGQIFSTPQSGGYVYGGSSAKTMSAMGLGLNQPNYLHGGIYPISGCACPACSRAAQYQAALKGQGTTGGTI